MSVVFILFLLFGNVSSKSYRTRSCLTTSSTCMVDYSSQFTRFGAENACFLPGLETWLGWSDPQILPCINGMLLKGMLVSIVKKPEKVVQVPCTF